MKNKKNILQYSEKKISEINNFFPKKGSKIAVGLSGGVDSAVVIKILLEKGYYVEGFFMRNWDSTTNFELNNILTEDEICQQEKDYNDAKNVAKHLGIKINRVDFIKEYWDDVFSIFLKQIEMGITPNPDILCNRHIKFDRFIDYIQKTRPEFQYIATGHYAKIIEIDNKKYLSIAKDSFKDQTYFLSEIISERLNKIIFPLANLLKSEVRKIAKENNLPVANKKDSTGICFIGKRNFPDFISNYLEKKPGKIVIKETGEVVGEHIGVLFYTIGQRKGLNLGGFSEPAFVSGKDIKNNILYVSIGKNNNSLYTNNIIAKSFNYLIDEEIIENQLNVSFKIRHSEITYKGKFNKLINEKVEIISDELIKSVTEGQELVVYFNGICIGGGQIEKSIKKEY